MLHSLAIPPAHRALVIDTEICLCAGTVYGVHYNRFNSTDPISCSWRPVQQASDLEKVEEVLGNLSLISLVVGFTHVVRRHRIQGKLAVPGDPEGNSCSEALR